MEISFLPTAWEQYQFWIKEDIKIVRRINKLIEDCSRNRFEGIGKPEPLKGDFSGWWSRRIDDEHRLVYRIEKGNLIIGRCRFHYDK